MLYYIMGIKVISYNKLALDIQYTLAVYVWGWGSLCCVDEDKKGYVDIREKLRIMF